MRLFSLLPRREQLSVLIYSIIFQKEIKSSYFSLFIMLNA
jgi:hypothetical protein